MFLPPGPMIAPIFSTSTFAVTTLGAYSEISAEGVAIVFSMIERMCSLPALGLGQGLLEDLGRDAGDLYVHLKAGDAPGGAGHLEVHVAEVVLVAEDVGEHRVAFALGDEAHRDARHGHLERDAGLQQGQRARADRGHGGGAVGLEDLRDDADRIGELLLGRQHFLDRAAGEVAVADLAPAGAEPADLADREGREIVVQHEAVAPVALDVVEDLLVEDRAQRGDAEGLGLAAREEGGAVGALEHVDLAGDGPDVLGPRPSTRRPLSRIPPRRIPYCRSSMSAAKSFFWMSSTRTSANLDARILDRGAVRRRSVPA